MYKFKINYINGHTMRYETKTINARTEEEAIYKLRNDPEGDFDHQIASIEKFHILELSQEEMQIIHDLVWIGIANGNTVYPKAYDPTPTQYRKLCDIANRI